MLHVVMNIYKKQKGFFKIAAADHDEAIRAMAFVQ